MARQTQASPKRSTSSSKRTTQTKRTPSRSSKPAPKKASSTRTDVDASTPSLVTRALKSGPGRLLLMILMIMLLVVLALWATDNVLSRFYVVIGIGVLIIWVVLVLYSLIKRPRAHEHDHTK